MRNNKKQDKFSALKEWFKRLDKKQKAALLSAIGGVLLISVCTAVTFSVISRPREAAGTAETAVTEVKQSADASDSYNRKSPDVTAAPSASKTPASSAPSAAATKSPSAFSAKSGSSTTASNANPSYNEESKQVQEAAKVAESSSSIARNAASQGGSNVVDYQERNEREMREYVKEEVPKEEQRLIATSAATCDIMDRLGIDLIGVPETTVSAIASRYNGVTRIGSPMAPDMEIIKTLKPTDVIGPDTLQADLQMQYDNIGVHSTFINLRSVEGLYDSVRILGDKYGKSAEADAIIQEYRDFMSSYRGAHSGKSPKVLVLMGLPGSYLVATQNSYAGSLVELAGGTNVFHHDSKDFISVNTEALLASDPDVIIRTAHGLPKEVMSMFEKEFQSNDIWKHFDAVKEGRAYDVDYMLFGMSATFDYPQALAELEPMLYGK